MPNVSMNIRIDKDIKKQAQKLFSEFGLDMTTAINMFLRQAIREQKIPFELKLNSLNVETIEALKDAMQKRNLSREFSNVKDLIEDLDA